MPTIKTIISAFNPLIPILLSFLFLGCSQKEITVQPVHEQPPGTPVNQETRLIDVEPVALDLPDGHKLGKIEMGVLCIPMTDLVTIGGKAPVSVEDFTNVIVNILERANYNLLSSNSNNIKSNRLGDELILKGVVKDLKANICFPSSGFRGWKIGKGNSYIKIDWNLISKQTNQTIFETITEGSYELKDAIAYGPEKVMLSSVAVATQNLIADENLVKLVISSNKQ